MKKELPPLTDAFIKAGLSKGWLIPPRDNELHPKRSLMTVIWLIILIGGACVAITWVMLEAYP